MKNCPQQPFGPLIPNKLLNGHWEIISMDLLIKKAYFIPINNWFSSKDIV